MELEMLKTIIGKNLGRNVDTITERTTFVDELGVDSLDFFQILIDLEETYDIQIDQVPCWLTYTNEKTHEIIRNNLERSPLYSGNIKSSIGLGLILGQGIGDTIRVSLTGDPVEEIRSAKMILKTLGLRKGGIEVVSCPTCGRTKINLIALADKVEQMVQNYDLDIKVAVMGCAVNGPGEAKEADIGIAGGDGEGLLIKKGQIVKKVPEDRLLDCLKEELDNWERT